MSKKEIVREINRIREASSRTFQSGLMIGDSIEKILSELDGLTKKSGDSLHLSSKTCELIAKLRQANVQNHAILQDVAGVITEIEKTNREVYDVIEKFAQLIEKASILGFNAKIEAARAGKAGSRFTVVANELENLARETIAIKTGVDTTIEKSSHASQRGLTQIEKARGDFEAGYRLFAEIEKQVLASKESSEYQLHESVRIQDLLTHGVRNLSSSAALSQGLIFWMRNLSRSLNEESEEFAKIQEPTPSMDLLMEWTSTLQLGIPQIDHQHKVLVDMINLFFSGLVNGKLSTKSDLLALIDKLANYTVNHFRYEEEWFSRINYDEAAKHAQEHKALVTQVLELKQQIEDGLVFITAMKMIGFLRKWLEGHILGTDARYVPSLKANMNKAPDMARYNL